jgi:hypothetical protein
MTPGPLTSHRFPYLPFTLTAGGRTAKGDALLDTGFDGHVVVPPQLLDAENKLLDQWLKNAQAELPRKAAARARLDTLRSQLRSLDRIYPVFMPGFSAPDVWKDGGWDIVIMNPPYVGRKEIPQRYDQAVIDAIEKHYGATRDLMILLGVRALQLTRSDCDYTPNRRNGGCIPRASCAPLQRP